MVGNIAQGKLEDGTQFRTLLPQEVRGNFYELLYLRYLDRTSKKIRTIVVKMNLADLGI